MAQTRDTLREQVQRTLRNRLFVVVSNREPYMHIYHDRKIQMLRPASGLTIALDPVMRAVGGLWVAHGAGEADPEVTDDRGRVQVPPEKPAYTLKRVWLTKEQEEGYYYGFANGAFWPLCHNAFRRPVFRQSDWERYREVNGLFAQAVAEEVGDQKAFIFIQDYHWGLLPRMLKERCPQAKVAHFWHIPWPHPEVFRICPWRIDILKGLLGNDMLCFHIRHHGLNFMDTVERELEARTDRETNAIIYRGHATKIRNFPISVDFEAIQEEAAGRDVARKMKEFRQQFRLPERNIGVGVDRADYTKGIPDRLRAIDRFLELHPEYIGDFAFVQVAVPSRVRVEEYRKLNEEIDTLIEEINWKYRSGSWKPIVPVREHLGRTELFALYRLARFSLVTSLQDGMNLVAKEFVAANLDEKGVLVLSEFTGAARELTQALIVNPYSADHTAEAIHRALTMDDKQVRARMHRLREIVRERNIYKWAADILRKFRRLG